MIHNLSLIFCLIAFSTLPADCSAEDRRPLLIASSGGAGHISAMDALIEDLHSQGVIFREVVPAYENQELTWDRYVLHKQLQVPAALKFQYFYDWLGWDYPFPHFPSQQIMDQELQSLYRKNQNQRLYYDMLLDFHSTGYDYAAIWNCLQRQGDAHSLRKLINLQGMMQSYFQKTIRNKIFRLLKDAVDHGQPYTEVISTQPLGISEICEAIQMYSQYCTKNDLQRPPVFFHQYLTDLPSEEAIHFFSPLKDLNPELRKYLILHLVGEKETTEPLVQKILGEDIGYQIIWHDYFHNPLVRKEFKNQNVQLMNQQSGPKRATLMLGSQSSYNILDYMTVLLDKGYHISLVGVSTHYDLFDEIQKKAQDEQWDVEDIEIFDYISAKHLVELFNCSDVLLIKGGGMTVMEQLAFSHLKNQKIYFHYPSRSDSLLSSGIPWEDANIQIAMDLLKNRGISVVQVTPRTFKESFL